MPGVVVNTGVLVGPSGTTTAPASTYFVVGEAERGPTDAPQIVRSMTEFSKYFGGFTTTGVLYQQLQTFFEEGGTQAQVLRVVNSTATAGTFTVVGRSSTGAALTATAANKGTWASKLSLEFEDGVSSGTYRVTVNYDGAVVYKSGDLASNTAAAAALNANVPHLMVAAAGANAAAVAEHALAQTDPQQWRAQLQRVLQSEQRASHLIDQLLALALADETRDTLVLQPLALDELVRDFVLRHMAQADSLGIDLGASGLDEPTWAWGQAALIEGVLGNLLDNALRYGRPVQGVATLTVALMAEADAVRLLVLDNGPGLSASEREAVLQRGVRVLPQSAPQEALGNPDIGQGAGLGLAIVSKFAGLMHARFALHEVPGSEGLCASVTFMRGLPQARAGGASIVI